MWPQTPPSLTPTLPTPPPGDPPGWSLLRPAPALPRAEVGELSHPVGRSEEGSRQAGSPAQDLSGRAGAATGLLPLFHQRGPGGQAAERHGALGRRAAEKGVGRGPGWGQAGPLIHRTALESFLDSLSLGFFVSRRGCRVWSVPPQNTSKS